MDEILKIIMRCNQNRELLSIDDVKKICYIVLKRNGYDFVKDVIMARKDPNDENCGGVFYKDKIVFYYDGIINIITKYSDKFTELYHFDGSIIDILNYFYLIIIFHELAHARQHYLATGRHSSLEKNIFSLFFSLSKDDGFYDENYDNLLTEVNAKNVSFMTAIYFYSKLPRTFFTSDDYKSYQTSMLKTMLYKNYTIVSKQEKVISPAEKVMVNLDEELLSKRNLDLDKYCRMIYRNDLTLYKKIMLGLPISYMEFAYANLLIDSIEAEDEMNVLKRLQKRIK